MILNFTCLEKLDALRKHECCHTFRMNAERFVKKEYRQNAKNFFESGSYYHYIGDEAYKRQTHDLQLYWNQRAIKKYEVCKNCGHPKGIEHCDKFDCSCDLYLPLRLLGTGKIVSIKRTRIGDITEEEAVADGFGGKKIDLHPDCPFNKTLDLMAQQECIAWLLSHNKGATLDTIVFGILWRWDE